MEQQLFKISVKTITDKIYTYTVAEYTTTNDGAFIEFFDNHTQVTRRYPIKNCQIIVVGGDDE
jgi:hypothetical protein